MDKGQYTAVPVLWLAVGYHKSLGLFRVFTLQLNQLIPLHQKLDRAVLTGMAAGTSSLSTAQHHASNAK